MSYSLVTTTVTASPQSIGASSASISIVVAPSATPVGPPNATVRESIPYAIEPPGGIPPRPPNTEVVQVGFREPPNYAFVAKNQAAQNQLFEYIPPGLSYVTVVQGEEVTMHSLRADNNVTVFPSYITTLAFVYMPTRSIDILKSAIQASDSPLYNNPDDSTRKLMS